MQNAPSLAESPRRGVDLASLFRQAARSFPASVAVDDGLYERSLGDAVARAERAANALDQRGVPASARIGVLSENRGEYVEADLMLALARRIRVALNARLHLEDHRFVAGDCGMSALVHSASFDEAAASLRDEFGLLPISLDGEPVEGGTTLKRLVGEGGSVPVIRSGGPEDPAWITYTSGTTGRPKGIVLSHRSIREVALNLLLEIGPIWPGELLVLTQPLSHGAGYFVLPTLMSGAGLYVMRRFDPEETYAVSDRPNVRILKCVPAMVPALMEFDPGRPLGYESVIYGASPIARPVLESALERFGPILMQIYGQSEAPVTITCLHKADHVGDGEQRFSAGRAFRAVTVEVRDEDGGPLPPGETGEVAVTGSHLMSGYLGLEEQTSEVLRDGWVMTKDMGVFDERGFLKLLGRRDEMIISGGYNISPREVEQILARYPGVDEVAVLGVPDERWGTAVAAAIRLQDGTRTSVEELMEFARGRLTFRAPKAVRIVDAIPHNAYGKIDRKQLLDLMVEPSEAAG
jgi:fatty-acyl-CoA synthase